MPAKGKQIKVLVWEEWEHPCKAVCRRKYEAWGSSYTCITSCTKEDGHKGKHCHDGPPGNCGTKRWTDGR